MRKAFGSLPPKRDSSGSKGRRRPVSLPLNKYRKVAVGFCSDQGAMKEYSINYMTEEQRRAGQRDQDLVCSGFSGNDTSSRKARK